jgi:hypothetical protein
LIADVYLTIFIPGWKGATKVSPVFTLFSGEVLLVSQAYQGTSPAFEPSAGFPAKHPQ